jgi:hypothetical protein
MDAQVGDADIAGMSDSMDAEDIPDHLQPCKSSHVLAIDEISSIDDKLVKIESENWSGNYVGDLVDGKPHGKGKLIFSPHYDDIYEGMWSHLWM